MPNNSFHGDEDHNAYNVLRKLQHNIRSNIPAMIAQRAMSSFSLHQEPPPADAKDSVFVVVYPQNPFVGEPEVREMRTSEIQHGLVNSRVQINDSRGVLALPDEEGHYLYWPGTPEFDQVNAFYYTTFTLRMFERYANRQIPWSFPSARIAVDPHVGSLANAFYNEQEKLLGFHTFVNLNGEDHSTARSADIVSHEAAHAVLDGLRDLYNESFSLGSRAFHESFSDIAAILVALHDDTLIRRVLDMTGGDLRTSNFVSEVAEHVTDELLQIAFFREHTVYLRNALNTLKGVPFDDLPYEPDDPVIQLGRQEHNYSRLFTGALYDILIGIYDRFCEHNHPKFVALYRARDVLGHLLVTAIELGPVGELDFSDMARALLSADAILYQNRYYAILRYVFDNRRILSRELADEHRAQQSKLPDLRLPDAINNALSASLFLEESVVQTLNLRPKNLLMPLSAYRNASGHAFLTYFSSETITLSGSEYGAYDGVLVDVFGGLTLMFDRHDRLCSVFYRPVTDEDLRQLRIVVAELVHHDKIATSLYPPNAHLKPNPSALIVPGVPRDEPLPEGAKLVKYPVIFDEVPHGTSISNKADL